MSNEPKEWYGHGLRFACTQCGNCCRGEGHVWVDAAAIRRMASFLDIEPEAFSRKFVRRVGDRLTLVDKPNLDCVFWESAKGCDIYSVRPVQCRTFPFWESQLASRDAWDAAARECPGMNRGPLHAAAEIHRILESD